MSSYQIPRIESGQAHIGRDAIPRQATDVRKVLFFGKNMRRTRCTGALVDAMRELGLQVRWLNMATLRRWLGRDLSLRWARREFRRYRPDLVFVFLRDLPVALLREFSATCRTVLWVEEALENVDQVTVDYFSHADLVCLSNPTRIPVLRELGVANPIFQMSGFSPLYHSPAPARRPVRDIGFIGGPGRQGQRAAVLARLSERYDVEVFGNGWEGWQRIYPRLRVRRAVDNRGYARICAGSRIMLGLNEINHADYYFSNRTFLTLACGGFHLTHYVPRLEDVFENGRHLVWYRNEVDLFTQIDRWLPLEAERAQVAAQGHKLVSEQHGYVQRMARILQVLRETPATSGRDTAAAAEAPHGGVRSRS